MCDSHYKSCNEIPPKRPHENPFKKAPKKKDIGNKGMAQDEDGGITMNHVAISGYKPPPRITNLGWQKAQTKSHSLLSSSHQDHSKRKEHTHLT
jgi:hypothetical protein